MNIIENLSVVVVGIAVVFLGLTILILFIKLTSLFFLKKQSNNITVVMDNHSKSAQEMIEENNDEVSDMEIVAAITSAIAMYLNKSDNKSFVVKHIKRISK